MSRTGMIFIQVFVSVLFVLFATIFTYGFVEVMGWRSSTRLAIQHMLAVTLILPVWFRASMLDKARAGILGVASGSVSIGVAAMVLNTGHMTLGSLLQIGAIGVSAAVNYSWLRSRRLTINP